ncbi:hypothetical protein [Pseudolysinimonas sp.]|uniref:hypothetical protein n=1 Tax=Pseudolysinimonas sp. TaxID=2680009 RepID=UPI003F817C1C
MDLIERPIGFAEWTAWAGIELSPWQLEVAQAVLAGDCPVLEAPWATRTATKRYLMNLQSMTLFSPKEPA